MKALLQSFFDKH